MISAIDRLEGIVRSPEDGPAEPDWAAVEDELTWSLPSDYKTLIKRYGGSYWDDYLYVLEPHCRNENYDLLKWKVEQEEILEEDWEFEPKPPQLAAEGSTLVPWATTDNGEVLFWLARADQSPEAWGVMIRAAREEEWEHFPVGCVEFLVNALMGELTSGILASQFPLQGHKVLRV